MKKRMLAFLTAMALLLGIMPVHGTAAEMSSEVIIAPQYEDAQRFSDGFAAVKKNGKWGYIDEEGNVVVDFQYDWAGIFNEGVAVTAKLEELAYDYGDGDIYTELTYLIHLIDADGMDVTLTNSGMDDWNWIPVGYSSCPVTVWYDEEIGGIDPDMLAEMDSMWFCSDGVVLVNGGVYRKDGSQIVLKSDDDLFQPADWNRDDCYFDYTEATGHCVNGVIPMYAGVMGKADGYSQAFYMDLDGNIIRTFTPANWNTGEGIMEVFAPDGDRILTATLAGTVPDNWGYCYVRYGVMDLDDNWIIEPEYTNYYVYLSGSVFNDSMLPLANESNLWGAYNHDGELVVDHQYTWFNVYSQGYAAVRRTDGSCVYLDTQGNTYQIGGINGGIATVSICSAFNENGVAAVYNSETGEAYCILNQPVNGVFPAIRGSEGIDTSIYFPDFDGTNAPSYINNITDIVVIEDHGLYGYVRLNVKATVNPFTDVTPSDYYYEPVLWALGESITDGVAETEFAPEDTCKRSQVVTFLWRAAGEPKPTSRSNPFVDVKPTDYFYEAVLWAVEKGITDGMDETHFEPDGVCNRSQVVTFLYRAFKEPPVGSTSNPFTDVPANKWYATPVLWAVKEGITDGVTETSFAPEKPCTRGQVVTFLYRAYVN